MTELANITALIVALNALWVVVLMK